MRVVQIIDTLDWGGAQKMMTTLTRALKDRNIDVTVISLDVEEAPFVKQLREMDIPVICLPGKHLFDPLRFGRLVGVLRRGAFDLVQTYLTYANILGSMAGWLAGLPVIASLRTAGIDRRYYHPLRFGIETWVLHHLVRRVVANGYAIADFHRARVGLRTIDVIPNAVPVFPLLDEQERNAIRAELTGERTGPLVISVGRMSPPKGYPDLITAFALLTPRFADASLVIVGDGEMMPQLREQVRSLDLEDCIFLVGARDDVPRLLMASDIYASASHWEGMSVALLEAMSAGLPVVATAVGDAPRMLIEGTGLLVQSQQPAELADALSSLLTNPRLCKRMGAAGRAYVAIHYDHKTWAKSFIDLYREVSRSS